VASNLFNDLAAGRLERKNRVSEKSAILR
jgi:hypothetical protein